MTEIKHLRSEHTKTYRHENGRYHTEWYPCQIHYYDEGTQQYEEYNSLLHKTDYGYITYSDKQEIRFKSDEDVGSSVEICRGDKRVLIKYIDLYHKRTDTRKRRLSIQHTKRPTVTFSNVSDNVDIEYMCTGDSLVQNIIVKSFSHRQKINFLIETEGLILKTIDDDSRLAFYNRTDKSGTPIFTLSAPSMIVGGERENVNKSFYKAKRLRGGVYRLTFLFSPDVLEKQDSGGPIVISSSIVNGNTMYSSSLAYTQEDNFAVTRQRGAINEEFLPSLHIPASASIISSEWVMESNFLCVEHPQSHAHTVGSKYMIVGGQRRSIFSEDLEGNIYEDQLLKPFNTILPHLRIEYVDVKDYQADLQYLSSTHMLCLNDYIDFDRKHLVITHTDVGLFGSPLQTQVIHSYYSVRKYKTAAAGKHTYGNGWFLSTQQFISVVEGEHGLEYIYTDAIGLRHYFTRDAFGNLVNAEGFSFLYTNHSSQKYSVVDKKNRKMVFDENGVLVKMYDAAGNFLQYVYKDGNISKIIDSYGRSISFAYRDGVLVSVTGPQRRKTTFTYNNEGQLIAINHPDGNKCIFAYDDLCRISSVTGPYGIQTQYNYVAEGDGVLNIDRIPTLKKISNCKVDFTDGQPDEDTRISLPDSCSQEIISNVASAQYYHYDGQEFLPIYGSDGGKVERYEDHISEYIMVFGFDVRVVRRVAETNGSNTLITEFNEQDLPVRCTLTDHEGNQFVTVCQYDLYDRLVATQDYHGIVTLHTYTAKGLFRRVTEYYTEVFNKKESLDVPEHSFIREYFPDKLGGYIIGVTDGRSSDIVTQFGYDWENGQLDYIIDIRGNRTSYVYDQYMRMPVITVYAANGKYRSIIREYTKGLLTKVSCNGVAYLPEYDGIGRPTSLWVWNQKIWDKTYSENRISTIYGTGEIINIDTKLKLTTYVPCVGGEELTVLDHQIDKNSRVTRTVDGASFEEHEYIYDEGGKLIEEKRNGHSFRFLKYGLGGQLDKEILSFGDTTQEYIFHHDVRFDGVVFPDYVLSAVELADMFCNILTRDKYRRLTSSVIEISKSILLDTEFDYLTTQNLTKIVDTVINRVCGEENARYTYTYDKDGRLARVRNKINDQDRLLTEYRYDDFGQLIRENNFSLGFTWTYDYDGGGNIVSKRKYVVSCGDLCNALEEKLYAYTNTNWPDLLTLSENSEIKYDAIGNPILYHGNWLSWNRVNLLVKYGENSFSYNGTGTRIQKNETKYILNGELIITEITGDNTIVYLYGANGLIGFQYRDESYYYQKSLYGDIIAIYNKEGELMVEYAYDAWGNCAVLRDLLGLARINPFRYKGYYWDSETGLYYVNKRYYDPRIGRFINPSQWLSLSSVGGCNLFLYHENDPVNTDPICGESLMKVQREMLRRGKSETDETLPFLHSNLS